MSTEDYQKRIESITSYDLDKHQKEALDIIVKGNDLLTCLPTNSGKTTVALTGIILQAFDKGQRAIITTPIKALSNQMYKNFQIWLTKIGFPNRITLITGDIQSRCTPLGGDGNPELLIMTSEILTNKLEQKNDKNNNVDHDLINVSVLVIDEMHYINDLDRGHVWEKMILNLPKSIQIIALSGTLSEPEKFCKWLNERRPSELVQRHDRSVPLHFGGFNSNDNFLELFNTKEKRGFETSTFKKIVNPSGNFNQMVNKLVNLLIKNDKLPAIVFCLSKARCITAAESVSQNLLYGTKPFKNDELDPETAVYYEEERQHAVKTIREKQDMIFRKYLSPYRNMLESLPGWKEFKDLLDKGVAYHHSGMLPILREYVEILYSEKLIKIVFGTETLALGIDLPCKTTVFTQLDKPNGKESTVMLRTDQFFQMASRAGRRGQHPQGFVIFYIMSKEPPSESEMRSMMFGEIPQVISQLTINPLFVLKSLNKNENNDQHQNQHYTFLEKTLLYHQLQKKKEALQDQLTNLPQLLPEEEELIERYTELQKSQSKSGYGMIKISQSQRKMIQKELDELFQRIKKESLDIFLKRNQIKSDLEENLMDNWNESLDFLIENEYVTNDIENDNEKNEIKLTIMGKVASGLSDGEPLLRAKIIAEGYLNHASFEEIASWLACFTDEIRPIQLPESMQYTSLMNATYEMNKELELPYETGLLVYLWCQHKDIKEICGCIDVSQLGMFVKSILRVMSYIEEMKKVLLGLEMYEVYNKLDNHQEKLMDGIVTNKSLYVGGSH